MPYLIDDELMKLFELEDQGVKGPEPLIAIMAIAMIAQKELETFTERYTPVSIEGKEGAQDNIGVLQHRMARLLQWAEEERLKYGVPITR